MVLIAKLVCVMTCSFSPRNGIVKGVGRQERDSPFRGLQCTA
jgi:hypothetical protein